MAVDVSQLGTARNVGKLQGDVDPRIMQRAAIICAIALAVLVGIKAGFWDNILP
jgi:hypothetical protein